MKKRLCCKCHKPLSKQLIKNHRHLCNECYEENLEEDNYFPYKFHKPKFYSENPMTILDEFLLTFEWGFFT